MLSKPIRIGIGGTNGDKWIDVYQFETSCTPDGETGVLIDFNYGDHCIQTIIPEDYYHMLSGYLDSARYFAPGGMIFVECPRDTVIAISTTYDFLVVNDGLDTISMWFSRDHQRQLKDALLGILGEVKFS